MLVHRLLATVIGAAVCVASPPATPAGEALDLAVDRQPAILGSDPDEQFGYSLAAGDLDGDGRLDVAVGAPGHEVPAVGPNTGAVYVFTALSFADSAAPLEARTAASRLLTGTGPHARFGQTLAVGDLTGDGIDDLVVGAPSWGGEDAIASGSIHVFLGRAESDSMPPPAVADLAIAGAAAGDRLGSSLGVADIDGDGVNDLLASAYRASAPGRGRCGVVYVLSGSSIRTAAGEQAVADLAAASVSGERDGDGLREIAVGDVNGDGMLEVLIAAQHADGATAEDVDVGKVYVLPAAALATGGPVSVGEAGVAVFTGSSPRGFLGGSIAVADVDSDGHDDLIASAPAARRKGVKVEAWGESSLVFGTEVGFPDSTELPSEGTLSFRAQSRWDLFGLPVIAGDLNSDGGADIVVAAQFADSPDGNRRRCGEVYLYWGSLPSVMDAKAGKPELADLTIVGAEEMESIGGALLIASIFGGERPDLAIGAPDAPGDPATGGGAGRLYVIPSERLRARQIRQRE